MRLQGQVEVRGEIASLVSLGLANEKALWPGLQAGALCSGKVVAGAGYQRQLLTQTWA